MRQINRLNQNDLASISKELSESEDHALSEFFIRFIKARRLYHLVKLSPENGKQDLVHLALSNYSINLVSFLEIFFKKAIVQFSSKWTKIGFKNLLGDKITINDAFDLYKSSNITKEQLIAHFNSFQSLEKINDVFTKLTDESFLIAIGKFEVDGSHMKNVLILDLDSPNWIDEMNWLFQFRHKLIHESEIVDDSDIEFIESKSIDFLVMDIALASSRFFESLPIQNRNLKY